MKSFYKYITYIMGLSHSLCCGCNRVQISTKLSINFTHSWEHQLQIFIVCVCVCVFGYFVCTLMLYIVGTILLKEKIKSETFSILVFQWVLWACREIEMMERKKSWKNDDYYNVVLYWCFSSQRLSYIFWFLLQSHKISTINSQREI